MRVGLSTIAYKEERFITPFLKHIPDWVETKLVLNSERPWFGEPERDMTQALAVKAGAQVVRQFWGTEQDQRNFGLDSLQDHDWVLTLDPDEFLLPEDWEKLYEALTLGGSSLATQTQSLYWKHGYRIEPSEIHNGVIATRPSNRFYDKRCITGLLQNINDVRLQHFSWARTDKEMWRKITHYAHAQDFDTKKWYEEVWLKWTPDKTDLHPTHPQSIKQAVPAELPRELAQLWP